MKLRGYLALLMALLLTLALAGCDLLGAGGEDDTSDAASSAEEEEEIDPEYPVKAGGIELIARPGRVVSLAPALTEKLYDLGMDDRLVGVSEYCDWPRGVLALSPCGTAQVPDIDVIETLAPHLIVTEAALPEDAMDKLDELGIPVAVLPHANSVDELYYTYSDLASLLEGKNAGKMIGESIAGEFRRRLEYLDTILVSYVGENGSKNSLYLRLMPFTVATGDTFEDELLSFIGLENIARGYENWEFPDDEARTPDGLAAFQSIDVIFMDKDFVTIEDLEGSDYYKGLPATVGDRYLYISSIIMERQSMRTLDLLAEMAAFAYPEAQPAGGFDFGDGRPVGDNPGGDEIIPNDGQDDEPSDDEPTEGDDMVGALDDMP